jgi:hypothetical protein
MRFVATVGMHSFEVHAAQSPTALVKQTLSVPAAGLLNVVAVLEPIPTDMAVDTWALYSYVSSPQSGQAGKGIVTMVNGAYSQPQVSVLIDSTSGYSINIAMSQTATLPASSTAHTFEVTPPSFTPDLVVQSITVGDGEVWSAFIYHDNSTNQYQMEKVRDFPP